MGPPTTNKALASVLERETRAPELSESGWPTGLGTLALAVWLVAGLVIVLALDSPFTACVAIVGSACVASLGGDRRPFRLFLTAGMFALVIRTVLFALSGHQGSHVLFQLPEIGLPPPFGGAVFGGSVTREVLITGINEGLRLTAILAAFGAFASLANTVDLVQLVPGFLFDAGLVVAIAMSLTPQMVRSAGDIREAQQMRGGKARWINVPQILVPLLGVAMERSIALAESMDSRGYATGNSRSTSAATWRAATIVAALFTTATACLWALGKGGNLNLAAAVVGAAAVAICMHSVSKLNRRTRYRPHAWNARDRWVAGLSVVVALIAVAGRRATAGPAFEGIAIAPLVISGAISLPAILTALAPQSPRAKVPSSGPNLN